ncbi:S49 family peptidase [Trinickia dinghuensis]|uniref:S49 family peptidase n=1 Tax=Trinickia dinghuensis TaxID=2291023 RepID=A0A3D8K1B3_9BURK|nr:S49 family peptidase [Trinickia dinghuensis]RDU99223.1 S49 family peptidase [Trinickia dinghuensis]
MTHRLPHLATRIFNAPLVIHPAKAEIAIAALADRLGISRVWRADQGEMRPLMFDMEDEYGFAEPGRTVVSGYDNIAGVARIEICGTLVQRLGELRPYSGMTGYDGIRQNFVMAMDDPEVKAVVLDIDSPGGEVAGCFDLVDLIYGARGRKPIWAILDESAYSGGYALASSADKIIVPRTGGVGSIGVVWMHVDWSKAITTSGLDVTFVTYGDRKVDGAPELPLSAEALDRFQADINSMGDLFVETVARNRSIAPDRVRATQASCYMGAAGVERGLADAVMAPDAAFRALLNTLA